MTRTQPIAWLAPSRDRLLLLHVAETLGEPVTSAKANANTLCVVCVPKSNMVGVRSGIKHDYFVTWNSILGRRAVSGACSRGVGDTFRSRVFWVPARAPPGRCGLHPLSRSAARQPVAHPGRGTNQGTTVASKSQAVGARILTRRRTRSRLGSPASCSQSSRRANYPRTQRPRR